MKKQKLGDENTIKKKKKKKPKLDSSVTEEVLVKKKKKKKKKPKEEVQQEQPVETEAEKNRREYREAAEKRSREERGLRLLTKLKRKDLVKECIIRGLPYHMGGESSPKLSGWLIQNLDNGQDITRLNEYDAYREQELIKSGHLDENKVLLHPSLKYGVTGNSEDWEDKVVFTKHSKKSDKVKLDKPRVKREKDESGVYKGTKKALTFKLALEGKALDDVIDAVLEAFPEANDKSISIWYKRALKTKK